jgi:ABC-type glycerol-3-phosphate transport system substrate-binding protein
MRLILPLAFTLSLLLSACGAESPAAAAPTAAQDTPRTPLPRATPHAESAFEDELEALDEAVITVWYPWYGVEASLFEIFVRDFNEKNEWGITVRTQGQVNFTNMYEAVNTALPTADRPDLAIALPEHALEWDDERVVTDLTSYVQDPVYGLDSGDIPLAFWNQDVHGAVRPAVPAQRTARLLLWNESWAGTLGFDSPPESPEDLKQQACRAQASMGKDGIEQNDFKGGWLVDTKPMTAYAWLLAFEGGVLEGEGYRFLSPNNIDALRFLRELSETACAWQAEGVDPAAAFAAREALFVTASLEDLPAAARAFAEAKNTDKWQAIAFPGANEDALVVYGSSYVVFKSTEAEQLACWLFIRWLMDPQQDARWVETTHLFPLRESTIELLGDYRKTHPQWAQALDLLPQGEIQPQLASWRTVKVMLGDGFTHMYRVDVPSGQVAAILAQMESASRDLSR